MKKVFLASVILLAAIGLSAQAPVTGDILGAFTSYTPQVSAAKFNGTLFYAKDLKTGQRLRSFLYDSIVEDSITKKPFSVQTTANAGFQQEIYRTQNDRFSVYVPATVGVSTAGTSPNVGLALGTGANFSYALGAKLKNLDVIGGYQLTHTSIGGTSLKNFSLGFAKDFGKLI